MTRTWVPEQDLRRCAEVLERRHLTAQISEGLIVLRALMEPDDGAGWRRHPCVRMWRGYERFYCAYGVEMCREFRRRFGTVDHCLPQYVAAWQWLCPQDMTPPWWWGRHAVHAADRATLVARFPEHYGPIWPDVEPRDQAAWPVPYVEEVS